MRSTWIIFFLWTAVVWGDAERIIELNARQRVADLLAYVEANPAAEDLGSAYAALIEDYQRLGDDVPVFDTMILAYQWAREGGADLQTLFGQHVRPTAEALAEAGYRKRGAAFLLQVRKDHRRHPSYQQLAPILDQLDETFRGWGVGDTPEIVFYDLLRKKHELAAYRGNVVLIDFWSYTEKRNLSLISGLQAAYAALHEKGFEIFSISEDNSPTNLDQYLHTADMPWVHALDKKSSNRVADALGISSTPNNFLIDQEGKIAGKNVYGKDLMRKVERLLGAGE